jgi:hypothetical protein
MLAGMIISGRNSETSVQVMKYMAFKPEDIEVSRANANLTHVISDSAHSHYDLHVSNLRELLVETFHAKRNRHRTV